MNPSQKLADEYSQLAESYTRYWAPVIHPMAAPLFEAMPLERSSCILDVGAGTGALWSLVQERAPGARIFGVDRAHGMLRAGGKRLRGRTAVMDAERLGLRLRQFDTAFLVFVLFHLPDPVNALREIAAALKPDGQLGVVVWGEDPGLPGVQIWTEELDRAQALPDPRDPAVMRQSSMDTPEKLAGLLQSAALVPLRVWSRRFAHAWTVENLLATQSHCGLPSRRLGGLSLEARRACLDRVRARFGRLTTNQLVYRAEVIYAIARVT
ncbi:MAG: class I SAM-dependent methyltransferase [Gemmatimonadales bacterium]